MELNLLDGAPETHSLLWTSKSFLPYSRRVNQEHDADLIGGKNSRSWKPLLVNPSLKLAQLYSL